MIDEWVGPPGQKHINSPQICLICPPEHRRPEEPGAVYCECCPCTTRYSSRRILPASAARSGFPGHDPFVSGSGLRRRPCLRPNGASSRFPNALGYSEHTPWLCPACCQCSTESPKSLLRPAPAVL